MLMLGSSLKGAPPSDLMRDWNEAFAPPDQGGIPVGSYNWFNGNIVKNANLTVTYVPNGGAAVIFVKGTTTPEMVAAKYPAVRAAWFTQYGWPTAADLPSTVPPGGIVNANPPAPIPTGNSLLPGNDSGMIPGYFDEPTWIPGVPNIAVMGGAGLVALFFLLPKKKRGGKGGSRVRRARRVRR